MIVFDESTEEKSPIKEAGPLDKRPWTYQDWVDIRDENFKVAAFYNGKIGNSRLAVSGIIHNPIIEEGLAGTIKVKNSHSDYFAVPYKGIASVATKTISVGKEWTIFFKDGFVLYLGNDI